MKKFFRSPIVVGILMSLLCIGTAAGIYFGLIQPTQAALDAQEQRYTPVAEYTDPIQGPQLLASAQKSLASAEHNVEVVQARWDLIQTDKNPVIDFSDRYQAWLEYNAEVQFDFAQRINQFLTHTGVHPLTLSAPLPTVNDPNSPAPTAIIAIPITSSPVKVFGSYDQIANHLQAWNRFSRIVVVNGLDLSGYNPFLTATYTGMEYIFTQNSDKPGPEIGVGSVPSNANVSFENVPEYRIHIPNASLSKTTGTGGVLSGGIGTGAAPPGAGGQGTGGPPIPPGAARGQ